VSGEWVPQRLTRHRPETTTLYEIVRENLATFYGAVDDGALAITLPAFVRAELDGYLDCGLLCRGSTRSYSVQQLLSGR
jgi:hypothetical protein